MSYIVPNNVSLNNLTASNHVSASAFYGDGSGLSNIATGGLTAVSTSGNITGSGTSLDPVGIKPDPLFNTVTASVVTASDVITDYINFNSNADPVWDNGRMWYNNATHELNYWTEVDGFSIKIGQQLVQRCQNDYPSTTLTKGTVVHITGSTSSDTPRVTIADWTNDNLSANTLGLVAEDIVGGGTGYVIVQGILKEYNTNGFNAGEMLYLSSSGQITNIKPSAPQHTVSIGQVVRKQSSNGSIYVSIQNGYEIGELHDVLTNGKTNGDLLVWDSSIAAWKNSNVLSGPYTFSGSQTITGSLRITNSITSSNGISARLYGTASYALDSDLFDGQDSSLFALKTDVSGAITGALTPYATLTGVSASFTTPTQVSGAITGALSPYVLSSALSSSFVTNAAATASLAFLTASNVFTTNQTITGSLRITNSITSSNGISARLYGTSSYSLDADKLDGQDSALFALKTDVTGAIANFPIRTEVSGAITGALQPYAKSSDVSSSFTTPLQVSGAISDFSTRTEVSGAITGALQPYAKSTDVSSSFGLKTDLTASYARLAANNTFTQNQIIDVTSVNDALRVTQKGGGNVIKIESEANDTAPFVITNTGMVGIRTATPSSALTIAGDVAASGSLTLGNSTSLNHIVSGTLRANNNRLIVDGLTQKVSILGDLNNQSAFFVGNTVNLFNGVYVDSANNVGIKTNSPSYALDVNGSATVRQDLWVDGNFDVDGNTTLGIDTTDSILINGTVTTNIKMSSGTGIDFSNVPPNTYTNSSILDDYEEGTYTNPGISTSGAATYSSTGTGRYTKVGNLVHYSARITVTNDSTTENLSVFGVNIPYTAKQIGTSGTTTAYGIVVYKKAASSDDTSFIGTISDTPTRVYLPSNIVVIPSDTTTFEISAVYLAA